MSKIIEQDGCQLGPHSSQEVEPHFEDGLQNVHELVSIRETKLMENSTHLTCQPYQPNK